MPAWHDLDSGRPCEFPRSACEGGGPLALGCEHRAWPDQHVSLTGA